MMDWLVPLLGMAYFTISNRMLHTTSLRGGWCLLSFKSTGVILVYVVGRCNPAIPVLLLEKRLRGAGISCTTLVKRIT
jgi:hypothetical protein